MAETTGNDSSNASSNASTSNASNASNDDDDSDDEELDLEGRPVNKPSATPALTTVSFQVKGEMWKPSSGRPSSWTIR